MIVDGCLGASGGLTVRVPTFRYRRRVTVYCEKTCFCKNRLSIQQVCCRRKISLTQLKKPLTDQCELDILVTSCS